MHVLFHFCFNTRSALNMLHVIKISMYYRFLSSHLNHAVNQL